MRPGIAHRLCAVNLQRKRPGGPFEYLPEVPSFDLESSDISDGAELSKLHAHPSAGGENVSPHLAWSGFPEGTQGFAVTCFDPDAPTMSGWWHWLAVNIPVEVTALARGAGSTGGMPEGVVQLRTDYGTYGYQGASPPPGDHEHRYVYAVHALDVESMDLTEDTPAAVAGFNLTAHRIGKAVIVPVFAVPA